MSESLNIDNNLSEGEKYKFLIPQLASLISEDEPLISSLSNITAALKQTFDKISWVGFYFIKDQKLFLGPFQGKIACTVIEIGKGVCGSAALSKETIIVPDVDKFPGHIACDGGSKSEIVVPLILNGRVLGVLDLDSYELNAFDELDKENLSTIVDAIVNSLASRFANLDTILS